MPANWSDLQTFLTVAREKGLSPAARITGQSPATIGRRMLAMERELGRELFIRHQRGYELTAEGRALLNEMAEIETRLLRITSAQETEQRPLLKISAGTWTTLALTRRLPELQGTPPDLRLRFVAGEDIMNISRREVSIGFRNQRPTEAGLAGRRLARVEFAPYATPDAPDLWIKVVAQTPSAKWLDKIVGSDATCEVTSPRNSLDLACAGAGRAVLPVFIGDKQAGLVRVGDSIPELAHDQWLVTHQDDRHLPHQRRAIDRLVQVLRQ